MPSLAKSPSSSSEEDGDQLRRGPWTAEEDTLLIRYIACHGEGRWNLLAKRSGLKRTGKSCRLRWLNYLKPDVKRGNLTPEEQLLILELHSKWGNRWSKIAQHLPGRTDNEIKNYWRTRVQKQARHLKIDSDSTAFQEVIRCIWMPRLLQKIQGSCSFLDISSFIQNSADHPDQAPLSSNKVPAALLLPPAINGPVNSRETPSLGHQEMNSGLEESRGGSSITCSEYMNNTLQVPHQIPEWGNLCHSLQGEYSPFLSDSYSFDDAVGSYDVGTFNPETGNYKDLHTACNGDTSDGNLHTALVENMWNMDDLW